MSRPLVRPDPALPRALEFGLPDEVALALAPVAVTNPGRPPAEALRAPAMARIRAARQRASRWEARLRGLA